MVESWCQVWYAPRITFLGPAGSVGRISGAPADVACHTGDPFKINLSARPGCPSLDVKYYCCPTRFVYTPRSSFFDHAISPKSSRCECASSSHADDDLPSSCQKATPSPCGTLASRNVGGSAWRTISATTCIARTTQTRRASALRKRRTRLTAMITWADASSEPATSQGHLVRNPLKPPFLPLCSWPQYKFKLGPQLTITRCKRL